MKAEESRFPLDRMTLGEWALSYADFGWLVFPLAPRSKEPFRGSRGFQDATTDLDQISDWWRDKPDANIGLATGAASGVFVLDVDGDAGWESLRALEREHGELPETVQSITGAGGAHFLFKHPGAPIRSSASKLGLKLDVRGDGGYIVMAPSIHPNGTQYQWDAGGDPRDLAIAEAPEWLLGLVRNSGSPAPLPQSRLDTVSRSDRGRENGTGAPSPERIAIARLCLETLAQCRAENYDDWIQVGMALHHEDPSAEMLDQWEIFSQRSEKWKEGQCAKRWASFHPKGTGSGAVGLGRLLKMAREDTGDLKFGKDAAAGKTSASTTVADASAPHYSDLGNSQRFTEQHGESVLYSYPQSTFFIWDGTRFKRDESGQAETLAKRTVRGLWNEIGGLVGENEKARAAKHAIDSEKAPRIQAILQLARSDVAVEIDDLDADPWLLNVKNGTVELKTGELRTHRREDRITQLAHVEYDDATCPLWLEFLNRIFDGNTEMIAYIKRLSGYCLTGDVSEQKLFFCHGLGANGKTVFMKVLSWILGDYARELEPDLLMQKKFGQSHTTGLTDLRRARLAVATEVEKGARLAEVLVKQITGGDSITARRMRENNATFKPTHKLFLQGNHRPRVRGNDEAIWRRISLIPFTMTIPPAERAKNFEQTLLAEASGIFTWMIEGCLQWQRDGLGEPPVVQAATAAYRADSDIIGPFLDERTEPGDRATKITVSELYKNYSAWCEDEKEKPLAKNAFNEALRERGLQSERGAKNRLFWIRIGLRDE